MKTSWAVGWCEKNKKWGMPRYICRETTDQLCSERCSITEVHHNGSDSCIYMYICKYK